MRLRCLYSNRQQKQSKGIILFRENRSPILSWARMARDAATQNIISAVLGNNILGQFGLMGRIGEVVREQSGLAYYAYSSLSAGNRTGRVVCECWYQSSEH